MPAVATPGAGVDGLRVSGQPSKRQYASVPGGERGRLTCGVRVVHRRSPVRSRHIRRRRYERSTERGWVGQAKGSREIGEPEWETTALGITVPTEPDGGTGRRKVAAMNGPIGAHGLVDIETALQREVEVLTLRFPQVDRAEIDRCVRDTYDELRRGAEVKAHLLAVTRAKVTDQLQERGYQVHVRGEDVDV
jgi:hypothetical protein